MTIIGDAAAEHERLQIIVFMRGRATLVREAAAKVPGHLSMAAEIAAATLEANALLIEGGEHEKRSTRAPTAHPPASESPLGRATWEVWRESIGRSSEGWDKEDSDAQRRWRAIALAEQGAGEPTVHPPEPEDPVGSVSLMEKLDRLAASLPTVLCPALETVAELMKRGKVWWLGHEYAIEDVRVSKSGRVVGLEEGVERKRNKLERNADAWLENERSQINEDD